MKMFTRVTSLLLIIVLVMISNTQAQMVDKKTLTLDGAKTVIAAAVAAAQAKKAPGGAIAVVDDGGNLIALERLDNTFAAAANIAIGKARTAAIFQRPTTVFENAIKAGRTSMVALQDFTPLQGGIPIMVEGRFLGAIGVSGAASAEQDEEIAIAGAGAIQMPGTHAHASRVADVIYLGSTDVAAAFAKGVPLVEVNGYKVHASRRDAPGIAEIHERDTDIIYVLDGSATMVTGGTAVDTTTVAPEEIRGKAIHGGQSHHLVKGDVIIVPNGVAHWFQEVKGSFTYYVVKVRAPHGEVK
jgi:glc operon protein GlcG